MAEKIETDEEFLALMRERFASKPYSRDMLGRYPEYWTDERYEALIAELLDTQRAIRAAAVDPLQCADAMPPEEWNRAIAEWAMWSIQTHDVGATPTHWHRVWSAIRNVVCQVRYDERRRIADALRADNAAYLGPTATALIESAITCAADTDDF